MKMERMDDVEETWTHFRLPAPAPRTPMPVLDVPDVRGQRIVLVNADGAHYGYRAWTDCYHRAATDRPDDWGWTIEVVDEESWWRFRFLHARPDKVTQWFAGHAYVE